MKLFEVVIHVELLPARRVERAIADLWAMRYRTVVTWLGGIHPPGPLDAPQLPLSQHFFVSARRKPLDDEVNLVDGALRSPPPEF